MILLIQKKLKLLKTCSKKEFLHSIFLGFLNPFLYYIVLFKAYSLLPAQQAQPLNQTWAIVLPLLSIVILKQRIGIKHFLAIIISFFGVALISTQGRITSFRLANPTGVILALASAFIWALFWIYNIKDKRDEIMKLFFNFAFGSIYLVIANFLFFRISLPSARGMIGSIYIGLFEMGITFVLWLKALQLSKTTIQVSNMIYIVPFLSLIVINFAVGEKVMVSTIIALFLIITGIIIQQRTSRSST